MGCTYCAVLFALEAVVNRIREIRKTRGWTQARFAAETGMAPQRVGLVENPESSPRIDTLWRIARALSVSIDELIGAEKGDF